MTDVAQAFDPTAPAATRIADLAKHLAGPGVTERFVINTMRISIEMAFREIERDLDQSPRKTMHICDIRKRFDELRASINALAPLEESK